MEKIKWDETGIERVKAEMLLRHRKKSENKKTQSNEEIRK